VSAPLRPGKRPGPRRTPRHDRRVFLLTLAAAAPGTGLGLLLLWTGEYTGRTQWTLTLLVLGLFLGFALAARERVVRPLQTLSNLLSGLREGDFSTRARGARTDDDLGLAYFEVNALASTLREERLGVLEATVLLNRVMREIDVAVFALNRHERLQLVNRAGERLLGAPAERVLGRTAEELGLDVCLEGEPERTFEHAFPGAAARWELRRGHFRQAGEPHHLIVLSDLTRALREEERQAWRRLVRVLSHEINNSLAPIHSIARTLGELIVREHRPDDWEEDTTRGLQVIAGRSEALRRFMASYAHLARLPPPKPAPLEVRPWVQRIATLETRMAIEVERGAEVTVEADEDQLDQLLINVLRNAVDAALETGGGVRVGWAVQRGRLELTVEDDGPGVADRANLFVPFFTTKPKGSGIGLILARQIAEAHGGAFTLVNRDGERGCVARLSLPLEGASAGGHGNGPAPSASPA
jgi:two-component system, NtrC family, nitrogen regulation sensor histidine kinase NtrY